MNKRITNIEFFFVVVVLVHGIFVVVVDND